VLAVLQSAPSVVVGTPQELAEHQTFVYRCIDTAAKLVAADSSWEDCNQVLLTPLGRALELVRAGKTSSGRALAVGLIGYAQLAQQLSEQLRSVGNATSLVNTGEQQAPSPLVRAVTGVACCNTRPGRRCWSSAARFRRFRKPGCCRLRLITWGAVIEANLLD
jgi:hypothetical protein